ncbi:hypothetical protein [Bradyrhizobium erythrophlei]|uniref:Uncharacterized protein n=1 Tax=Bradyrhizobium erythrophlei TaxID=1437360 RepID=A0A1M5NKB8_9BRAD|nr:hypothetical protein [Bradyrhizobium erythrophlei]SHG89952.1 hypothetical protein SAMN05443248_3028 [Bradyrhizobium erythrophlei]
MNGQPTLVRVEQHQLASRNIDGALMYPGTWKFTWVKAPHMPWVLVRMEQA